LKYQILSIRFKISNWERVSYDTTGVSMYCFEILNAEASIFEYSNIKKKTFKHSNKRSSKHSEYHGSSSSVSSLEGGRCVCDFKFSNIRF
jgi:hypothetical protein